MRLWLVWPVISVFLLASCASSWQWEERRGVHIESPKIVKAVDYPIFGEFAKIMVLPFASKNCPPYWQEEFARSYANALIEKRLFAGVQFSPQHHSSMKDATMVARSEGKDFLLYGRIDRLLATGGGQPQGIRVEMWVISVKSEYVVFHLIQEGYSVPGKDIDLYWRSYAGRPGASVSYIVGKLAEQFAELLLASEKEARKKFDGGFKGFKPLAE